VLYLLDKNGQGGTRSVSWFATKTLACEPATQPAKININIPIFIKENSMATQIIQVLQTRDAAPREGILNRGGVPESRQI
jgi:hypothetical protein